MDKRTRGEHESRDTGQGQAIVEFALVSVLLLLTVFGTIDFGRAIYLQSQLDSAVREAGRELKTRTASQNTCSGVTQAFAQYRLRTIRNPEAGGGCGQGEHPRPGLETATAIISCAPSCTAGSKLTVTGSLNFKAVTQSFLGIGPITLRSSVTVTLE
jgi:hypothetical protein